MDNARNKDRAMSPGDHIKIIPVPDGSGKIAENTFDQALGALRQEAWSAGYVFTAKSVAHDPKRDWLVVLYRLDEDPSFRPPL